MSEDLGEELRRTFLLTSLRREAELGLKGRHWQEYRKIREHHEKDRQREEREHQSHRPALIEQENKRLIDKAASTGREFKPRWASIDRFDQGTLLRQAKNNVEASHEARLNAIDQSEQNALENLLERAGRENQIRGRVRLEFSKNAEPSEGQTRRLRRQR